jgi:hypothetical protein
VDFVFGIAADGKTELQAVRFNDKKFTAAKAHAWLKEHKYTPILFENAISKADTSSREPLIADLYIVDVVKSNDRNYAEAAYILDGTKGLERNNLVTIEESIDTDLDIKKGQIISVSCSNVEPTHVHGKYGVKLINPFFSKINPDRKTPDTTKNILQKADYADNLLVSDFMRMELSTVGLIKDRGERSIKFEQVEGSDTLIVKHEFPFYKDNAKHVIYGIVYEPNTTDSQGDITTAEEIEKAAHTFLEDYNAINLMHQRPLAENQVKTCESYIAPQDFTVGGQMIRKGSWVLASHILDKELWDAIEKGYINAYSMEGTGQSSDFSKRDSSNVNVQKRYLVNMIIRAVALVDKGANRKKFFLMKREDTMDKEKFIALVKSALLNAEQVKTIGKELGLKDEEIAEISKSATAPAKLEDIIKGCQEVMKASAEEIKKAIVDAVSKALEAFGAEEKTPEEIAAEEKAAKEAADAAANAGEKMPPDIAKMDIVKRAEWCAANPNAEVPDDCMSAVLDILTAKQKANISQTK